MDDVLDTDEFYRDQLRFFCKKMEQCLVDILQTKMLYQNCSVDISDLHVDMSLKHSQEEAIATFQQSPLLFSIRHPSVIVQSLCAENQVFAPETVSTDCATCKGEITPHNPIKVITDGIFQYDGKDQTIVFIYKCQKCKKAPLVFLVRRQGFKLQLVGRNHVSRPTLPASFPKEQESLFLEAETAFRTGSHLASVCLLRVALEQYMRRVIGLSSACSGDQLWEFYKQRLPTDFPFGRVCNLGEIYGQLSEVMHRPDSLKDTTFSECREKLNIFFEYVSLFPLVDD